MRTAPGRPDRPTSSGTVTCFSTSSAARPGKSEITVTCVSVTSGKASTGRFLNANAPAPMNNATPSAMNSGWYSAKATMRRITSFLRRENLLEQQVAVDDHVLARLEAVEHHLVAVAHRADPDRAAHIAPAAGIDEHIMAISAQVDRVRRDEQAALGLDLELRRDEHL